jgi:hypothetical protein
LGSAKIINFNNPGSQLLLPEFSKNYYCSDLKNKNAAKEYNDEFCEIVR